MKKIFAALLAAASLVSAAGFTDAGSMEAGGRISLSSYDYNIAGDERGSEVMVEPIFNIYVVDQLYVCPKLHFRAQNGTGMFGIGAGVGYAFVPDNVVVPYIEGGLEFIQSGWVDRAGIALPVSGGIKIPVYPHVNVDVNANIYTKIINDNPGADFGLAAGVTIGIF